METVVNIDQDVVDAVERIVRGGIALTARAVPGELEDVTFAQWRVLTILGEREAEVHVSGVGQRIGISAPSASRMLRRLEDRGFVELRRDDDDRRYMRVRLTDAGRSVRTQVIERRRVAIRDALTAAESAFPHDVPRALDAIGDALIASA